MVRPKLLGACKCLAMSRARAWNRPPHCWPCAPTVCQVLAPLPESDDQARSSQDPPWGTSHNGIMCCQCVAHCVHDHSRASDMSAIYTPEGKSPSVGLSKRPLTHAISTTAHLRRRVRRNCLHGSFKGQAHATQGEHTSRPRWTHPKGVIASDPSKSASNDRFERLPRNRTETSAIRVVSSPPPLSGSMVEVFVCFELRYATAEPGSGLHRCCVREQGQGDEDDINQSPLFREYCNKFELGESSVGPCAPMTPSSDQARRHQTKDMDLRHY